MFATRRAVEEEDVYHAANLADALSALRNGQTRWLVANGKGFNDEDAKRIARALHHNKNLQELSLAGNRIGPEGAEALGFAVGVHPFLKEFYLQKNRLGQEGIERFAAAVQAGGAPRLEVVNTSSNGIGPSFPPGLALPGLKSLIVKNNSIQVLPSCYGECDKLSNVVLDNNPLTSPPMDVYVSNGWMAIKSWLEDALAGEKARNRAAGIGAVSDFRRDEALLGPVRKLIKRGALHDAAAALERARSVLAKAAATEAVRGADDLAGRLLAVMAMDDPAVFPLHLDCCLRAPGMPPGTGLAVSGETLAARAPLLLAHVRERGYDAGATLRGSNVLRRVAEVEGSSRAGLRCLVSFVLLGDLGQAVAVSARAERSGGGDSDSDSDSESTDDDDDDDDEEGRSGPGPTRRAPSAAAVAQPAAVADRLCGYIASSEATIGGETPTETAGEAEAGEGAVSEGLSGEAAMILEAAGLAGRFGVEGLGRAAEGALYERLRPESAVAALRSAHRRGEAGLKRACLAYLDEHGGAVPAGEWEGLRGECGLMVEAMDSLARADGRPPSARAMLSSVLVRHVLHRLDKAEAKATRATELRRRTESSLRRLHALLAKTTP